jgi:hypothetical protein
MAAHGDRLPGLTLKAGRREGPSVTTGKHRRIRKDAVLALCCLQSAPQYADYCDSKSEYRMNGSLHCCLPLEADSDGQATRIARQC